MDNGIVPKLKVRLVVRTDNCRATMGEKMSGS